MLIKQNDEKCLPVIQSVGCFFRSALHVVERKFEITLTVDQINNLWLLAKEQGIINAYDDLINSAKLMNLAIKTLLPECKGYFAEIGISKGGFMDLYGWATKAGLTPDFFIRKIIQGGPSVYHYIEVDEDGNRIFDPHEPEIRELGEVYTICYRYFDE